MMLLNKFFSLLLLLLIISGSLLSSTSFAAGRRSKFVSNVAVDVDAIQEDDEGTTAPNKEEVSMIHERVLRANTKDYGRYDPSPALSKPPFKLIPN